MANLNDQMLAAQIDALSDADKIAFGLAEAKVASDEELREAFKNTVTRLIAARDWDCLSVMAMWFVLKADEELLRGLSDFINSAVEEDDEET